MKTRSLGVLCAAGSAVIFLDTFRRLVFNIEQGPNFDTVDLIVGIIWSAGAIAGLLGLIRLNVLGVNPVVRALGFVPIIGFTLLILGNIFQQVGVYTTDDNMLAGAGWMVEMAGMVLVGILAIAAKVWTGWRRFVPLLTVVAVPLSFGLGKLIENTTLAILPYYLIWVLLGYLVATAEPAHSPANLVTA